MELKSNERLVLAGEMPIRAPNGEPLPAVPVYMIAPDTDEDTTAGTIAPNERLILAGSTEWSTSQNLDKPEKEITDPDSPPKSEPCKYSASANLQKPRSRTNNHSYSRKEVMKIAKSPPPAAYWQKRYPGYEIISGEYGFQAVYTEPRGWCLYLKFRRIKQ